MKSQNKLLILMAVLFVIPIVIATPSTDRDDYIAYDDFEGAGINTTFWAAENSNFALTTTRAYSGSKSLQPTAGTDADLRHAEVDGYYYDCCFSIWMYDQDTTTYPRSMFVPMDNGGHATYVGINTVVTSTNYVYNLNPGYVDTGTARTSNDWVEFVVCTNTDSGSVEFYIDRVLAVNYTGRTKLSMDSIGLDGTYSGGTSLGYQWDLLRVWTGQLSDEPQVAVVEITNSTYKFTSGITASDQNNWTSGTKDRVNTYDTTPTVKFNTTIESVCAIGINDGNITNLTSGTGDYCAERDSYSHTCTYSTPLSYTNHSLYVSCAVNNSGVWESQLYVNQSTSRELPISIEVETLAVNLMSPENDNLTTDTTPTFEFNLSTTLATNFTCDLYINNTPYGDSNSSLCYQEFANVSTSCGGLVNGSYTFGGNWINVNNVTDGDWDTYGESSSGSAYLYINYTKPSGATSNSLWQKKDHIGISNISISSTCWDYSNSILMLRAESDLGNLVGWSCYNGTNCYGLLGDFGGDNIYEEGMWWNMPIKNGSIATITANESLSPGNYTWYVNCTDGTYMNQSDVRGIKISEIPITDSCTYTSGDHIYQCSDNCSIPPINAEESFILINGTGTIRGVGNITNASKIRIQGGCRAIA